MSGTSLDGIDAAVLVCDGESIYEYLGGHYLPYPNGFKENIKQLLAGNNINKEAIVNTLTLLHYQAVKETKKKLNLSHIDIIGFHGQSIKHDPKNRYTEQIGNGKLLANLSGTNVIYDFRTNDVRSGGEGAPLVPIFLNAISKNVNHSEQLFLNIGGVANICYCSQKQLIAYDVGPGNAPMNDLIQNKLGLEYDEAGKIASTGTPNLALVQKFLEHDFFKRKPPKSLDRNQFDFTTINALPLPNALATLTNITAYALNKSLQFLPTKPIEVIVSGGGKHNENLLKVIEEVCNLKAVPCETIGIDGDLMEAYAFGYLAVRSLLNLPISFPSTTGVKQPHKGGIFCSPEAKKHQI